MPGVERGGILVECRKKARSRHCEGEHSCRCHCPALNGAWVGLSFAQDN